MKRSAGIHISEQSLQVVLKEALEEIEGLEGMNFKLLALEITRAAKRYSLPHRQVTVTNDKILKKVQKLQSATMVDVVTFNKIITVFRQKELRHRGIKQIKETDKDWGLLREVAGDAERFAERYKFANKKDAFIEYVYLGNRKMNKFGLNRFKNLFDAICELHECGLEIHRDPNKHLTEQLHYTYTKRIADKIGMTVNYRDSFDKYACFVRAVAIALKLKVKPELYLQAQFEGFDWLNVIPEPSQLIGEKAMERFTKFAYKNNIQVNKKPDASAVDFSKIRKK